MGPSSQGGIIHYFVLYCLEFLKFVSAANQIVHDTLCVMCDSITDSLTNYLSKTRPSSSTVHQTQTGCLANESRAEVQDLKRSLERHLLNMEDFIKKLVNNRNQCSSLLDDRLWRKMDKAKSVIIKLRFSEPSFSSETDSTSGDESTSDDDSDSGGSEIASKVEISPNFPTTKFRRSTHKSSKHYVRKYTVNKGVPHVHRGSDSSGIGQSSNAVRLKPSDTNRRSNAINANRPISSKDTQPLNMTKNQTLEKNFLNNEIALCAELGSDNGNGSDIQLVTSKRSSSTKAGRQKLKNSSCSKSEQAFHFIENIFESQKCNYTGEILSKANVPRLASSIAEFVAYVTTCGKSNSPRNREILRSLDTLLCSFVSLQQACGGSREDINAPVGIIPFPGHESVSKSETEAGSEGDFSHDLLSKAAEDETVDATDFLCPSKVTKSGDKSRSLVATLGDPFDVSAHEKRKKHSKKKNDSDIPYESTFEEDSINVYDNSVTDEFQGSTSSGSKRKKHKKCKKSKKKREFSEQDWDETAVIESERNERIIAIKTKAADNEELEMDMMQQSLSESINVADREIDSLAADITVLLGERESEACSVERSEEEKIQNLGTASINLDASSIGVNNKACNVKARDTTNTDRQLPKTSVDPCVLCQEVELVKELPLKNYSACWEQMSKIDSIKLEASSCILSNVSNVTAKHYLSGIESSDTAKICDQVNISTEGRDVTESGPYAPAIKMKQTTQTSDISNSICEKKFHQAALNITNMKKLMAQVYPADQCETEEKVCGDESGKVTEMGNTIINTSGLFGKSGDFQQPGLFQTSTFTLEPEESGIALALPVDSKIFNLNPDTSVSNKKGQRESDKKPVILSDGEKTEIDSDDRKYKMSKQKEVPQESYKGMPQRVESLFSIAEVSIRGSIQELSEETIAERNILMLAEDSGDGVVKDFRSFRNMDEGDLDTELDETENKSFIFVQEIPTQSLENNKSDSQIVKYTSKSKRTETSPRSVKKLCSKNKSPEEQTSRLGHKYCFKLSENEASERLLMHPTSEASIKAPTQRIREISEGESEKRVLGIENPTNGQETYRDKIEERKVLQLVSSHLK